LVILGVCVDFQPSILPSNTTPLGALPARFRRTRILVVGCGDVGMRLLATASRNARWMALTSSPERVEDLRAAGALPLQGNLDQNATLARLAGLAQRVVHLAPPPSTGRADPRTTNLARALARRSLPERWVYASTSGVYGDCGGDWVSETRPLRPQTDRALRRVDAEATLRWWGRQKLGASRVSVLRVPGIYAPDREGGTPRERLQRGTPVLNTEEDVYTNHIHADDLARACWVALWRAQPQRVYNISDDSVLKMGDYYDLAADLYGLSRPPRISRLQAQTLIAPMTLSFMSESRRLTHDRMKRELKLRLHHPHVIDGLRGAAG
jgi:nucleoside-diphosphate-sugar epimerase